MSARRFDMPSAIATTDITGLILAGGRGSRMGGVDKGLQLWRGLPLAQQVLLRLRPQVGQTLLNANRNLAVYRTWGLPVLADSPQPGHTKEAPPDFSGPLAGFLAGLTVAAGGVLLARRQAGVAAMATWATTADTALATAVNARRTGSGIRL